MLSPDLLAQLQSYDWPGNVRQLKNLMEWLLIMAPGGPHEPIKAQHLPPQYSGASSDGAAASAGGASSIGSRSPTGSVF